VFPESFGGRRIVIACRQCNEVKGNMLPQQWAHFIATVPRWWDYAKLPGDRGIGLYLRLTLPMDANKVSKQ
jgi:hypothetical protein